MSAQKSKRTLPSFSLSDRKQPYSPASESLQEIVGAEGVMNSAMHDAGPQTMPDVGFFDHMKIIAEQEVMSNSHQVPSLPHDIDAHAPGINVGGWTHLWHP